MIQSKDVKTQILTKTLVCGQVQSSRLTQLVQGGMGKASEGNKILNGTVPLDQVFS